LIDFNLIEECRNGNLNNFRKVVEASTPLAFSVAFRMLGDEHAAKDAVQETMVTVWRKLPAINTSAAYKTWLYRIVVNKCQDELRKRKKNREVKQDDPSWMKLAEIISDNSSEKIDNSEMATIISGLTEKLSPKQKTVFILSDMEDMTSDEIEDITGMNKLIVKANLYYARKSIRAMLQRYM